MMWIVCGNDYFGSGCCEGAGLSRETSTAVTIPLAQYSTAREVASRTHFVATISVDVMKSQPKQPVSRIERFFELT